MQRIPDKSMGGEVTAVLVPPFLRAYVRKIYVRK